MQAAHEAGALKAGWCSRPVSPVLGGVALFKLGRAGGEEGQSFPRKTAL